ncbi:galectin-2-like [Nannospalax galili]|uniref:galectin-2-like n=1 Tax=Nannospalax galili TaxID=1026970 RepID=UPI0004ED243D|nr:galectin-2-like [Nannospalax galili]
MVGLNTNDRIFYIKLGQGKDLLNLVFNPRFDESAIVLNSWDGTNWGQELRVDHMCFSPGSDVKFTMVFQGNQFQVTLPDGYVTSFPNRLGQEPLHYVSANGLYVSSFQLD